MDKHQAIRELNPTIVTINGDTAYDNDMNEVSYDINAVQALMESKAYIEKRQEKYAQLNQFEMQFNDQRDGTTTWVDAINDIKAQFPKGGN